MLYQKLLMGSKPYWISVGNANSFEIHRHPEIELSYCTQEKYDVICENEIYSLNVGDLLVIPPMAAHSIPDGNSPTCECVIIECGFILLDEYFELFTNCNSACCFRKSEFFDNELYHQLTDCIHELSKFYNSNMEYRELLMKGNLYKISALILQMLNIKTTCNQNKKMSDINKIDKALEYIYNFYYEPLTVEKVSIVCGYSKSNFCKIFKNITGDTFHNTLNKHRVEIACLLLRETNHTIEKIASETGFPNIKSFCRVFKEIKSINASKYRKLLNKHNDLNM